MYPLLNFIPDAYMPMGMSNFAEHVKLAEHSGVTQPLEAPRQSATCGPLLW